MRKSKKYNKKTYFLPVQWSVCGTMVIEARSLSEAIQIAHNAPLPDAEEYLEESFVIDTDLIPFKNDNLTEEEKRVCQCL